MPYIWGDDAEDFRPERWLNNGVFQPKSPFKFIAFHVRLQFTFFFCLQKRLYVLIFISGKNKNENMEMERVIEFPHACGSLSQKETAFGLGHCSSGPQAVAFVIGIAVCCCLPCIIAILYAVADQEGATKEDIERLPKYKFRRIGDFEKQNGEIQYSFGGIITECNTDSPIEHVLSPENAECLHLPFSL
ncbi:unnamed protein product [Camellia sinensis]